MIKRWQWVLVCAISGLLLLFCGLRVPAYLRAVDADVILNGPVGARRPWSHKVCRSVNQQNLGTAWLFLQAAQAQGIFDREILGLAVTNAMRQHPAWLVWGNDSGLEAPLRNDIPGIGTFHRVHGLAEKPHAPPWSGCCLYQSHRAGVAALPRADRHHPVPAVTVGFGPGF